MSDTGSSFREMHPLDDVRGLLDLPATGLSDLDANRLLANPFFFERWRRRHGVAMNSPETRALMDQAERLSLEDIEAMIPPVECGPSRRDAAELRSYVNRAAKLPRRIREVFELFVEQAKTLDETAKALGIGRETVRVHLRRLRALARRDRLYSAGPPPPRR